MKPKLLLHICCAPDEAWVVQSLKDTYELYCFFSNPNVFHREEYEKRIKDARRVAETYKVPFEADKYEPAQWEKATRDFQDTSEGGERCYHCFLLRFRAAANFCKQIGWQSFTSVMSISPHKKIDMLDKAGKLAAEEFGVQYESFNFKKKDGFKKSIVLSEELGLYRQDYCGCRLSRQESEMRKRRGQG